MGLDLSIEIYCAVDSAPEVIRAASTGVATLRTVQVKLPTGHVMAVPTDTSPNLWEQQGVAEPIPIQRFPLLQEYTFPVDERVRDYCRQEGMLDHIAWLNGRECARPGHIYLRMRSGDRFAALFFDAPTSGMSLLFWESQAIRGYFLEVMHKANGLVGVIHDTNDSWFYLLDDPHQRITIGKRWVYHHGHSGPSFDRFVEQLLRQVEAIT
jgi:hypothetical protein